MSLIPKGSGIILATLSDPFSQLLNRIMGLAISDINAVGFYYRDSFNKNRQLVTLYNIYDNHTISWIPSHTNINNLLDFEFVEKIILYPLDPIKKNLEDTFERIVLEIITYNNKTLCDKNVSYTRILLQMVDLSLSDSESLITGYSLANRALLTTGKNKISDISGLGLLPCPFLSPPVVLLSKGNPEQKTVDVMGHTRSQIIRLIAIFSDLFITHDLFRNAILNKKLDKDSKIDLQPLFDKETQLLNILVGGLTSGIMSNTDINDIINQLGTERFNLGNYSLLPMSMNPVKTIEVTGETVPYSFQLPLTLHDTNPLRDLGTAISQIAEGFVKSEPLTINIASLVGTYNLAIQGSNLPKIEIPHIGGTNTLSRQATVTVPGKSPTGNLEMNISSRMVPIPMFDANLSSFSDLQLRDLLVYIQSLRDIESTETRYINLQNEITHELARRQNLLER